MIKNIDVFEKDPIPKAVFKLALPTVLSMIVAVFYNMVDTFFVGRTGDPNQVAAVSVATPVFLFFMAAGNIFGMGGSSFLSRALGEKQYDKAKKISSFCLYAGLLVGVIGAILMFVFMRQILNAVGTSENTFGFAKSYLSWIAYGGPAIVISTAFTNLIRGEGAAQSSMKGMMAGTVANIILDPIFILDSFLGIPCLGLGVAGAAIATVIGNLVSIAVYFFHVVKSSSVLTLSPRYFQIRDGILKGVLLIGLPASITNILMSLSNILMNKFLVTYGDVAVAGMGIAMKANMLVVFVQLGLGAGVQPLVGYNFGARNFRRMKDTMKFAVLCNTIAGVILAVLYWIFTRQIVSVFIGDGAVIDMGVKMLRALMYSSPLLGIMFVLNFSFQAMGKAKESLALAVSRQGFVFVPCTIILNSIFHLEGLILSQPIADIVSIIMAISMFMFMNRDFKNVLS
ncbi:MATE family efflux transporter [Treponema ruminis]|uniref:Multidrug export protein MepA n=1 Tax=Treponema ruminis TaxID=744515 RepID=A0A7W8LKY7_9SPIR|nr:MATE family efflux transporter [Treponema ruminis]MBB5224780.1 putative MATE family efflux protein [Treponema ruminis]